MRKTLFIAVLSLGVSMAVSAATTAVWEFSSNTPKENFTMDSGISLEGWEITSSMNSTATYVSWATMTPNAQTGKNDRNISTQTVGMWLDLSSTTSSATIYTFGATGNLQGLQLIYNGNGSFTSKRTGGDGQTFSINQDIINNGWFNLTMALNTNTSTRKTDFQFFLNGEEIVNTLQLTAGLNGGQNGTVSVGGNTSADNSFKIADFKAYDSTLTGEEIKEAWGMVVPEPATASLSVLGLAVLMMRRRRA